MKGYEYLIFFITCKSPNKLEGYMTLSWNGLQVTNTLVSGSIRELARKRRVMKMTPVTVFTTLKFFITCKRRNKLECYITLSLNGLQVKNTLA